jgi:hypothetical protein
MKKAEKKKLWAFSERFSKIYFFNKPMGLVARGVAKKSRKTKKVRKKISLFLTKIKYAMFSAKHVVLTR